MDSPQNSPRTPPIPLIQGFRGWRGLEKCKTLAHLSQRCHFLPGDDLEMLFGRVRELANYVLPSVN